ncbi:MAG: preprotein translocase subunit SecY [Nitrospira sp. SB0666_bin_27]|nr:preprotein translocase subunit SecY [Nitrospira sp. SB0667_bin_9]MYA28848.1 preprotein translocase subunit SecY [Nitrospira sp. SB0666_bin_27]MYD30369.1 preprotein translocase subunit SecY [Nitrospira sp. SB0661_bin_20]MYF24375.1 preprotein translocase subunit SecY [Nitrospira sp. SB0678_bin_10]MYG41043.1 preprotein translocase subunit SecY [Nitrospira sp. SB0677_bin_15]MYH01259.1 preprotein translocase subunit SecY [Nitrospira sp. SB0675_bin_23]MYJ22318.1 preprotein translocase subunit Se
MLERLITSFQNILKIPELRSRVLFTLAMLAVYRIGAHIPTPGINNDELAQFLLDQGGALLGFLDIFSGGSLSRLTIFALGIMPYISASIILQLLTVVIPHLSKLAKEGERGRKTIIQYTRYGTIGIALIQGFGIALGLEGMNGGQYVLEPGWPFRFMTVITLTAGTAFLMWLGEQITERGVGNGISLIIFAGIVARLPSAVAQTFEMYRVGELSLLFLILLVVSMLAVITAIVFLESGRRRVPVQYAKRVVGRRVYGGQSTHIPLKINTAGVIPPIFASSIIAFPATITSFIQVPWVQALGAHLAPGSVVYTLMYVGLIIFFCFFYTAVVLNPVDMSDNMKKYGGFIPGIRPGQRTADYIYRVLTRITFAGSIYLAIVCVIPELLIYKLNVPFYFGGTSLLIVVGVGLDTAQQIESHMLMRNYEGFLAKGRLKGRSG